MFHASPWLPEHLQCQQQHMYMQHLQGYHSRTPPKPPPKKVLSIVNPETMEVLDLSKASPLLQLQTPVSS